MRNVFNKQKHQQESSWTILVTSGPQSAVRQFKFSKYLSFLFIFFILSTIITAWFFYQSSQLLTTEKDDLYALIEKKEQELANVREEKEQELAFVQEEYEKLEQEAYQVQATIDQFKSIEETLSNVELQMPADIEEDDLDGSGGLSFPTQQIENYDLSEYMKKLRKDLPKLKKDLEETLNSIVKYEKELKSIPTFVPASEGRISSEYGNRADPFTSSSSFHSGLDIAAPLNTPIYAAASGEVIHSGTNGGYGLTVIIDHSDTYDTLYAHLNYIDVEVGEMVEKGEKLGGMGTTGRSTGVHLHFEIIKHGEYIDPLPYMTFGEQRLFD